MTLSDGAGIPAQRLCALCADAYAQPPSLAAGDAYVVLAETEGTIIAAFRGSASIEDWWADFRAGAHIAGDHPELGACHAGFLADVVAIAPLIVAAVGSCPLAVTGHSKGGAEAQLFAGLLAAKGRPPVQLTTFGAPRAAAPDNTRLAALLAPLPGTDYRHRDDPVPGEPRWLDHKRPVAQLVPPRLELDVIADHYLSGYAAALRPLG